MVFVVFAELGITRIERTSGSIFLQGFISISVSTIPGRNADSSSARM
jgi:hypothetical protein